MDKKLEIINFCKSINIHKIGFLSYTKFYELKDYLYYRKSKGLFNEFEESDIEKRIDPRMLMKDMNTIISIAFPYAYKETNKGEVYFSKYTLGKDYHEVLKKYLKNICDFIINMGGKAQYYVDSNCLPERYIAMKSGVGFLGKNNCLVTEEYGSYVFLGEILTDLYIEGDTPMENKCGNCHRCLDACPTKAILYRDEEKNLEGINNNANNCLSYITQKKHIDDFWFDKFQGTLWGCDRCQEVCPFNINAKKSDIVEFKPRDYMKNPNLQEIINLDNEKFKSNYKELSCGWRGKNILIRNALICEYNTKGSINELKDIKSPYIKAYYDRLLNIKKL